MVLLFLLPVRKSGPVLKHTCTSRDPEVDLLEKSRFVVLPSRPATIFIEKKTSCCPRFVYIEHIPRRVKQMFMFHDFKIYTDLEQNNWEKNTHHDKKNIEIQNWVNLIFSRFLVLNLLCFYFVLHFGWFLFQFLYCSILYVLVCCVGGNAHASTSLSVFFFFLAYRFSIGHRCLAGPSRKTNIEKSWEKQREGGLKLEARICLG